MAYTNNPLLQPNGVNELYFILDKYSNPGRKQGKISLAKEKTATNHLYTLRALPELSICSEKLEVPPSDVWQI